MSLSGNGEGGPPPVETPGTINMSIPHNARGTLVLGGTDPVAQKHNFYLVLTALILLSLVTLFCLGYVFLGEDEVRREMALKIVIGCLGAVGGFAAAKLT